jgi:hypothetical protein
MSCKQQGVKVVCIPQRGGTKTPEREAYEKTREFKDGQRFRAGIEGRISTSRTEDRRDHPKAPSSILHSVHLGTGVASRRAA